MAFARVFVVENFACFLNVLSYIYHGSLIFLTDAIIMNPASI